MVKYILSLLIFLASITVNAQKWYVATTGSDTDGDGSETYPWLTVKHAADTVTGVNFVGDTIMVGAGSFTEPGRIELGLGVSLVGAGQGYTTINSTYTATGITDGSIYLNSAAVNPVDGDQVISDLKLTGNVAVASRAIAVNYRNNVIVQRCIIQNFRDAGVQFRAHDTAWNLPPTVDEATGNEVSNCIIDNCSSDISAAGGNIIIEGQSGFQIKNNWLEQIDKTAGDNHSNLEGYWNDGTIIYNNDFIKPETNAGDWNFQFELHYSQGGVQIYNNRFVGHGTLDCSGNKKGVYDFGLKVYDNTIFAAAPIALTGNEAAPAITLESFTSNKNVYIFNNHIKNFHIGISCSNQADGADSIYIYYNIIDGVENLSGIYSYGIDVQSMNEGGTGGAAITDMYIYNNVVTSTNGRNGIRIVVWGDITNLNVKNNIVTGTWAVSGFRLFDYDAGGYELINSTASNNISYGTADDTFLTSATLVLTNCSIDNPTDADPLFISSTNYRLQANSPAINAGTDVSLTSDYDGNPIVGIVDIGAFEYQTLPVPTTGLGWEPVLSKRNFKDDVNLPQSKWMIDAVPVTTTAPEINNLVGTISGIQGQLDTKAALSSPAFTTSITVTPGDTTVTAVVGKIVYKTSDNHLYICRQLTAKKWYQLDN